MEMPAQARSEEGLDTALAIVLEGVSEKWQMNVLQIRGCPTRVKVTLDGYGTLDAPAISLTPSQARHLATQITEILGTEGANPTVARARPSF
jgi:hypothetical protein